METESGGNNPTQTSSSLCCSLSCYVQDLELPGREEAPLALAGAVGVLAENECFSLYKWELPFTALSCVSSLCSQESCWRCRYELTRQELAHGRITDFLEYGCLKSLKRTKVGDCWLLLVFPSVGFLKSVGIGWT